MRLVVTASREWDNPDLMADTLDDLHRRYTIEVLFHGNAYGGDQMAKQWAQSKGIPEFGSSYASAYGKAGGPIRNGWLLKYGLPDLVAAFPTPSSVGTWNCVTQAKALGINIRIVKDPAHA